MDLWEGATFTPLDRQERLDTLLAQVQTRRTMTFLALDLKMKSMARVSGGNDGIAECLGLFKTLASEDRRRLVSHPLFSAWLAKSIDALSSGTGLTELLADFDRMVKAVTAPKAKASFHWGGLPLEIIRFDVDPLISQAVFPEYRFPTADRRHIFEKEVSYSDSFFVEMLSLAMKRIERTWPVAHQVFPKFVSAIVDMVDSEYTSYSRFEVAGAIFISTDDSSVAALEEYLIHELGHQILYYVMELEPLLENDKSRMYALPWSGSVRDVYGYFHAFFIYIMVANYYRRMQCRSFKEERRRNSRLRHIVQGLIKADAEFRSSDSLTKRGRHLFSNLSAAVNDLANQPD